MHPKQPPTKRSQDTEDPPPRKTRSDTYALKAVAPPQPPGADSSNRRITDFFRAPAPPLPPAEPPPLVSSTPESFSPPPIACPTPPQHSVYSRPNTERTPSEITRPLPLPVNHPIHRLFPHPLLSCGASAFTAGMNLKVLDNTIAGSGYRNPASRPRKSCGIWTKCKQHSSAWSPLTNGVCPDAAC